MSDIKHDLKDRILFERNYTPPLQKIVHSFIDVLGIIDFLDLSDNLLTPWMFLSYFYCCYGRR
jgi:hypothetical protein